MAEKDSLPMHYTEALRPILTRRLAIPLLLSPRKVTPDSCISLLLNDVRRVMLSGTQGVVDTSLLE